MSFEMFLLFFVIGVVFTIAYLATFRKPKDTVKKQPKPKVKGRDLWWLWKDGVKRINSDGSIPFAVLWEFGSKMNWGVGGALDRDNLADIISDNITERERAIIIAATVSSLKRTDDKQYIAKWIHDTIERKEQGYYKKDRAPGEYWVD